MATLTEQAQNYLYNLNSMTRKIHQDIEILRRNQNEDWDDLGEEKQEELLDKFFVDEAVKQKYATDSADGQDVVCFPKYVVNCGEKIVIDFDNDVSFLDKTSNKSCSFLPQISKGGGDELLVPPLEC